MAQDAGRNRTFPGVYPETTDAWIKPGACTMNKMRTFGITVALASAVSVLASSSALAWGCRAVTYRGGYGYSHGYADRRAAIQRAMYECQIRNRAPCHFEYCDPRS